MGDNENWRIELEDIDRLSLIDVSAEDDNLLLSSILDPTSYEFSDTDKEDRGLCFFGDTYNCDEEILDSTLEEKEPQKMMMMMMMKTSLRKSLAWDKAFFTNAGVLEPEEISSMMETNHLSERTILPTIQEDLHRSTESISTLKSDCTVEENGQEFVMFEDVKPSIERSAMLSDAATPDKSKEFGVTESASSPTTSTLDDLGSQEEMIPNPIRTRPSSRGHGLGKVTKQTVTAKELDTSISRPSNGLIKTIRSSEAKQEKNLKLTGGKEPLVSRVPISRRTRSIESKPVVSFESALRSSVASKHELTSSCSSLESCLSVSSSASKKSSLDSARKKKDQSLRIASHSFENRPTSRAASRNIDQPKVPLLSANRIYKSKLSSNLSSSVDWSSESPRASHSLVNRPTSRAASRNIIGQPKVTSLSASRTYKSKFSSSLSSSVDWSSESWRASTPNKMAKGNKKTVPSESSPATQTLKPLRDVSAVQDDPKADKQSAKRGSVVNGDAVRSSSSMMKPTGLRVPLPKIGYFDGGRSSVARTPTGSIMSKAKASPVSRNPRLIVSASPKLTNKMYSKVSAEEQLG